MIANPRKVVVIHADEETETVALAPSPTLHEYQRTLLKFNARAQLASALLQQWARSGIGSESTPVTLSHDPKRLALAACDLADALQSEIEKRNWAVKLPNTQAIMGAYEELEPSIESKFGIGD